MFKNLLLLLVAVLVFAVLFPFAIIRNFIVLCYQRDRQKLSQYLFNMAHGVDVLGASVMYRTQYKTISGVTGRKDKQEKDAGITNSYIYPVRWLIDWLFKHEPKHCHQAYLHEYKDVST